MSELHDVVIVGGGLAGSIAATLLARAGVKTALIDLHETYPHDFRAEQIVGVQIEALDRLGLLAPIATEGTSAQRIVNARKGRLLDVTVGQQFGLPYENIVAQMRRQIPDDVKRVTAKVTAVQLGDDEQTITTSDGETVSGRLVVMTTGLNAALARSAGVERQTVRSCHSVSIGFDIQLENKPDFDALTYYGERLGDDVDYLSLFPIEGGLRVNLFVYWPSKDPRIQRFKQAPAEALHETLPGLSKVVGPWTVTGPVQMRPIDLYKVEGHARAGLAMAGDAFQTSCPAAGTGIERLLSDVERLCMVHIPAWLATPGMAADKIAAYYTDPSKVAADKWASHVAEYRRSVTTNLSLRWRIHRLQVMLRRRIGHAVFGLSHRLPRQAKKAPAVSTMGGMAPHG